MLGGLVLLTMALSGAFAGFVAPYGGSTRDSAYIQGPPQLPKLWDHKGFSARPFVTGTKTERDPVTLRLAMPVSTPPGPSSAKSVTPRPDRVCRLCFQRTGLASWADRRAVHS